MQVYVILGFVLALLAAAVWAVVKVASAVRSSERNAHKAKANEEALRATEERAEWSAAERDRQLERAAAIRERIKSGSNKPTEPYLPTQSGHMDPADAKTSRIKKGAGSLLMACALLGLSTGCTRTVYVEAKCPVVPMMALPSDDAPLIDWQVWALTHAETISNYNERWAR